MNKDELHELATMTEEELLSKLGRSIYLESAPGLGAKPPSVKKLIEIARQWLSDERVRLEKTVCRNKCIRDTVEADFSARQKLIQVLIDSLSAAYTKLPLATIAELLVRDGVKRFCRTIWAMDDT